MECEWLTVVRMNDSSVVRWVAGQRKCMNEIVEGWAVGVAAGQEFVDD